MNYVIVGNSAAGVGCVEGIRQLDAQSSITLISKEPHHTYSRPLISYLLLGKTDEHRMRYRDPDFYETNRTTPILGHSVTRVDAKEKMVRLDDGRDLPYDKLLLAVGSSPFVPPMEGLDTVPQAHTFTTLSDAHALMRAVTPQSRVLIVGAGLIGLKCAEGLSKRAGTLTVVDLAPQILPSILDAAAAALIQAHIESQGVTFHLGASVQRFDGDKAHLTSGAVCDFDVLVVAVGVRPNTALAKEAGVAVERGIVTNDSMRTNVPDIYAAGDCTESYDISCDQRKVLAVLPNAYYQGETAGIHMAGGDKPFRTAMPLNAVGFWGKHIVSAGSYDGDAYVTFKENGYRKLVTRDDQLRGFILVGDVQRAGIYTSLIREKIALSSIDFEQIKDNPGLIAFSKRDRASKLGGGPV